MRKDGFFFDLDGTITDSRPGLFASFRAGLAVLGMPEPDDATLQRFLGTPLPAMLRALRPAATQAETQSFIEAFRAHFEQEGILDNRLYPGARQTIERLRALGRAVWIVTSKPEPQAIRVLGMFGLDRLVSGLVGASLAEIDTKTELVARALRESGILAENAVMVGDRNYDMIGARENHVVPIGVLWGYGTRAELTAAGCRLFADDYPDFDARYTKDLATVLPRVA